MIPSPPSAAADAPSSAPRTGRLARFHAQHHATIAALKARRWLLVPVLVFQTLLFAAFARNAAPLYADNARYEISGYYLASGRGLSLPYRTYAEDPEVFGWACTHHVEVCRSGVYPFVMYPPGYSIFIGLVYSITGRSVHALVAANLLLMLAMFAIFEALARRYLDDIGYLFAMAVAAVYPFFARQAVFVMADQLHSTLLLAAIAAFMLMKPGLWRGAVFGSMLGAATIVRPYSLLAIPAIFVLPPIWRHARASWREWALAALLCALPFVAWTARNAYWFGRFIPVSTAGLGVSIFYTSLEGQVGLPYTAEASQEYDRRASEFLAPEQRVRLRQGDLVLPYTALALNRQMQAAGVAWAREHPFRFASLIAVHAPKTWISLGVTGRGTSRLRIPMVAIMGGLLALGLYGAWLRRKDRSWHTLMLLVAFYWLMLLPSPPEARRTLPLRLPMLLLAATAVSAGANKLSSAGRARV